MNHSERFLDHLNQLTDRLDQVNAKLSDPEVLSDVSQLKKYGKERAELEEYVTALREYKAVHERVLQARELVNGDDEDMAELAEAELEECEPKMAALEAEIAEMLFPADPNDKKDVIMEIRAGTGGEEAALFAGELYRMYTRYAEAQGWDVEVLSTNETGIGGLKEAVFSIRGRGVYGKIKFESGVHRVQRVPATEGSGVGFGTTYRPRQ